MRTGYLVPTLFFGGLSALGFWLAQRKARKVKFFQQEELEVSQVKGAGVCKVHGLVVAPQPLASPLSGTPCAWYRVLVQEYVRAGRASRWAAGSVTSMVQTVGAAQKWVMPPSKSAQVGPGSILGMQTLSAPTAARPQVKHQPLQWNIGRVHR